MAALMKPQSISEQLMYCTAKLISSTGSGTGYFVELEVDNKIYPILVTNKHVLNYNPNEKMSFLLHIADENGHPGENIAIQYDTSWHFHPIHDLCFTFVNPLLHGIEQRTGKKPFVINIPNSMIAGQETLNSLSALEELVMVGYPIGLWDDSHNLPIFRRGYTATHPAIDFTNAETGVTLPGVGVVDMACFNGSSGSPIFVLNENGYHEKNGTTHLGATRVIFIGTLYAGPEFRENGEIKVVTIPTSQALISSTPAKTNLGYYIKSTQLEEFRAMIRTQLKDD